MRKFEIYTEGRVDTVNAHEMQNVSGVLRAKKFNNGESDANGTTIMGEWKSWTAWKEVIET
jgi:hypothetical protein